jgi:hypothetical protein
VGNGPAGMGRGRRRHYRRLERGKDLLPSKCHSGIWSSKPMLQNLHTPSQFCTGSQAIPWLGYSQAGARYYMLVVDSIEQERWYAVVELAQIVGGQRTW